MVPPVPTLKPRPSLEILAEKPLSAEVIVGPRSVTVTLALPQVGPDEADIVLTRHSIRIRHKQDPARLNVVVPLPVAVEPERYVLRQANGIYDFVVERPSH